MTDPVTAATVAGAAAKAVSSLSSALSAFKTARELAKDSKDSALKNALSDIYDKLVDLKADLQDLRDENEELTRQLANRANVRRDETSGYFYKESDTEPLCPRCYQGDTPRLRYLSPLKNGVRMCSVCSWVNREKSFRRPRVSQGPNSWMAY